MLNQSSIDYVLIAPLKHGFGHSPVSESLAIDRKKIDFLAITSDKKPVNHQLFFAGVEKIVEYGQNWRGSIKYENKAGGKIWFVARKYSDVKNTLATQPYHRVTPSWHFNFG